MPSLARGRRRRRYRRLIILGLGDHLTPPPRWLLLRRRHSPAHDGETGSRARVLASSRVPRHEGPRRPARRARAARRPARRAVRHGRLAQRQRHVHPAAHPHRVRPRVLEPGFLHRRPHPGGQHRWHPVRPARPPLPRRSPGARRHLLPGGCGHRGACAHGLLLPGSDGGGRPAPQRGAARARVPVGPAGLHQLGALRALHEPLRAHLPRLVHDRRGPELAAAERRVAGAGRVRGPRLRGGGRRDAAELHAAARVLDAHLPGGHRPGAGRQPGGLRAARPAARVPGGARRRRPEAGGTDEGRGGPAAEGRGPRGRRRQAGGEPVERRVRRPAGHRGRPHGLLQRALPQHPVVLVPAVRHRRLPPGHQPGRHGQPPGLLPALLRGPDGDAHVRRADQRHPGRGRLHPGGVSDEPDATAGGLHGRPGSRGGGLGGVHRARLVHQAGHRLGAPRASPARVVLVGRRDPGRLAHRRRPRLRPAQLHDRLPVVLPAVTLRRVARHRFYHNKYVYNVNKLPHRSVNSLSRSQGGTIASLQLDIMHLDRKSFP